MQYKNIEVHNVAHLIECENGGVSWLRVPQKIYESMESDQGKRMCHNFTGVELRFVMKSDSAVIKLGSLTDKETHINFNVFFGGVQAGWDRFGEGGTLFGKNFDIAINKPQNMDSIKKMSVDSGYPWDPEVVRVIINRGVFRIIDVEGDVCPPEKEQLPEKTILAYGSSITHASNSLARSNCWTSVLAHNLKADLINLGMAGSCRMEPELIDYIAEKGEKGDWNIALLELGINVLEWDTDKIRSRVTNAITQVALRNPDKKVYVISPFYCRADYHGDNSANKWRTTIEEVIRELSYPNVEYINGLDILGDVSGLSGDEVHPNIYGIQQIADRMTKRIRGCF